MICTLHHYLVVARFMWCLFLLHDFFGLYVFSDEMKRPKHDIKRQTRWTRPIYHSFLLFYFFQQFFFFGIVYVFILKFACVRHKQHNKHEHHLNVFDCRAQNNFSAATISHAQPSDLFEMVPFLPVCENKRCDLI